MFTRIPGLIRETNEDGEQDPPIERVLTGQILITELGIVITTEDGDPILI